MADLLYGELIKQLIELNKTMDIIAKDIKIIARGDLR